MKRSIRKTLSVLAAITIVTNGFGMLSQSYGIFSDSPVSVSAVTMRRQPCCTGITDQSAIQIFCDEQNYNPLCYRIINENEKTATVCGSICIAYSEIKIPDVITVNGKEYKVTKIEPNAFEGQVCLEKISGAKLDIVAESVRKRAVESGKDLPNETIEMIALAALKFNDLMHDVKSDYVFDTDSVTQFEGRTGPYVLYTAVRLNSVVNKAHNMGITPSIDIDNISLHSTERNLLLRLLDFERVLENAFTRRATDLLANFAYDLCQDINTFYHHCPILRDDIDASTKQSRLQIVEMARKTLLTSIDLMGLRVPNAM